MQQRTAEQELIDSLTEMGYGNVRPVPGRGLCGIFRFAFTYGLIIGMDLVSYYGRYCYPTKESALEALETWDGVDDPPGPWIKYKGEGGERSRLEVIFR